MAHNLHTAVFDQIITTATTPAAGADFTFTAPGQVRILPVSIKFQFVADANAANRNMRLVYNDGSRDYYFTSTRFNVTANETRIIQFSSGMFTPFIDEAAEDQYGPLSPNVYLEANDTIKSIVENIQVGDAISVIAVTYLRWIHGL